MRRRRFNTRRSLVTALELLPREDGTAPADVRLAQALRDAARWLLRPEREGQRRRILSVDRRLVVTTPVEEGGTLAISEVFDVGELQVHMSQHDILVRGGLTIGEVEARADFATGSALAAAEQLRDIADVPRVVIDPRVFVEVEGDERLRSPHHTPTEELHFLRRSLRQDSDGLWFVDYLCTDYHFGTGDIAVLEEHRAFIERGLASAGTFSRTARSWTWLWYYHNTIVDDLQRRGALDEAMRRASRVPAMSPLLYAFPPGTEPPADRPQTA